jgi:hypothetical protein
MTAILMSFGDHSGGGAGTSRTPNQRADREPKIRSEPDGMPRTTAERPKSLVKRVLDAINKPIDPTFHNP